MTDSLSADINSALKHYFGYDRFRPLQERIIRSIVANKDVCVIMPTGGGKSLCYQLPAAISQKTTVVISPLIALMNDQVVQLTQMGIPAALLNSSLPYDEQKKVMRAAREGKYRLLYLSPERLVREDTVGWLRTVPLGVFAIDEAHCISEWGHEFRPEYRQLKLLRNSFPDVPIAAFTASATQRVRHDIVHQLALREPDKYIASFHRPNLRYIIRQTDPYGQRDMLLRALRSYAGHNVIVYAPTIKMVEEVADFLIDKKIPAVPYHGQMDSALRTRNQEKWMTDEVRVLVGTIAFGLGINKPAVRAVIHLAVPKSLENYYQEAGRAGRDGLPADCVMLWQPKDLGLLVYFIQQMQDTSEKKRAWERYQVISEFVKSDECRHKQICEHFGEKKSFDDCVACDICGATVGWMTAPVPEPMPGDPPIKLGLPEGKKPKKKLRAPQPSEIEHAMPLDDALLDFFRLWRRDEAKRRGVPAYVVMHDTSLEHLCRVKPKTLEQVRSISGFGDLKTADYGPGILKALAEFDAGKRALQDLAPRLEPTGPSPSHETLDLLRKGHSFAEIANIRGRQLQTVMAAVANLVETGDIEFDPKWVKEDRRLAIENACEKVGTARLKPVKDLVAAEVTLGEVHLVVAKKRWEEKRRDKE
ncbi:ATP-dependent DNA helicase, RecQ family [Candidatus Koribacter versatilis Ellin345]|uniref:ATP-dependent DNA helicase RecQ n=1 Tax=Koribacter versatilis (strain Ellin345) TaxID=204669 RepID=Q1IKQ8_KORVE|nr:ATP-dependent DNA helicase RecQ [Candidatus Koribacter versatilis]ABF42542.1 ATP-dependent DNA helicase, RecQ family [Candidatus Koribacter versatilis Ellin345]